MSWFNPTDAIRRCFRGKFDDDDEDSTQHRHVSRLRQKESTVHVSASRDGTRVGEGLAWTGNRQRTQVYIPVCFT